MTTKQAQYAADRLDPRWQKKRLEIMQRDGFKCACCGTESSTLNVHHCYYVSKRKAWDYPDWSLVTYCRDCHEAHHCDDSDCDSKIRPWEVMAGWFFDDTQPDDSVALWELAAELKQAYGTLGHFEALAKVTAFTEELRQNKVRENYEAEAVL